jgi:hypothetical protein
LSSSFDRGHVSIVPLVGAEREELCRSTHIDTNSKTSSPVTHPILLSPCRAPLTPPLTWQCVEEGKNDNCLCRVRRDCERMFQVSPIPELCNLGFGIRVQVAVGVCFTNP